MRWACSSLAMFLLYTDYRRRSALALEVSGCFRRSLLCAATGTAPTNAQRPWLCEQRCRQHAKRVRQLNELGNRNVCLSQLDTAEVLNRDAKLLGEPFLSPSPLLPQLGDAPPKCFFDLDRAAGSHPRTVLRRGLSKKHPQLIVFSVRPLRDVRRNRTSKGRSRWYEAANRSA